MRLIVVIILSMMCIIGHSQTPDSIRVPTEQIIKAAVKIERQRDTIDQLIVELKELKSDSLISTTQIIKAAQEIQDLRDTVKYVRSLNDELAYQIRLGSDLMRQDSMLLAYREEEIDVLNVAMDRYSKHMRNFKTKWYDSKIMWFIGGAGTVYLASIIVRNVK